MCIPEELADELIEAGGTLVGVAPEPEPKPVEVKPRPMSSEDAIREQRTRGLPAGHWRDPHGLIRNGDGRVACGIQRQ